MTTNKNGKTVVNNVRDLKVALEGKKPDTTSLVNNILGAYASEYAIMDQVKARKDEIAKLESELKSIDEQTKGWGRIKFETEKAIAKAKEEAKAAIKASAELTTLKSFLESKGKGAEWDKTCKEFVQDWVVSTIDPTTYNEYLIIVNEAAGVNEQREALKAAIANEKAAIADLQK